jgi:pimeloyl-ACP methyl ester carboxylesterase
VTTVKTTLRRSLLSGILPALTMVGYRPAEAQLPTPPAPASVPGVVDTLVDVGGYRLRFRVVPGRGTPVVFEAGGGDDVTVWGDILSRVAALTGAPAIAYDRPGFGRSEIDTTRRGVVAGVEALEAGLSALGYGGDVVLVAHSLGGFYATLFAARHPSRVKGAVLLDANHACFFTDHQLRRMRNTGEELARYRTQGLGRYFQAVDFDSTVAVLRRAEFPASVPVIDIVAERPPMADTSETTRWARCHAEFVAAVPARTGIIAYGSDHYVFRAAPELVLAAIVKTYAEAAAGTRQADVLTRGVAYAVDAVNAIRRREAAYRHSETAVNEWGYALLGRGEREAALAVFRVNVALRPTSANAHDSLAEAYEATGDPAAAVRHYRRAIELDPASRHAAERLRALAESGAR